MKKCWSCAEQVQDDAIRCRYCGADLQADPQTAAKAKRSYGKSCLAVFLIALGILFILAVIGGQSRKRIPPTGTGASNTSSEPSERITAAQYQSVTTGMSYSEVTAILGPPTEEMSRTEMAGISTGAYSWKNTDGSNALIMFQNGNVVSKAQSGLR